MDHLVQPTLDFVAHHADWAIAIMFIAAFGESLAVLSLLFPGTTLLIAAGTLASAGTLPYVPIILGAIAGAILGDALSYWGGRYWGGGIARMWPFTRHPDLLPSGIAFFERHGGKSVFIGRFFGPMRAVIPLAAGVLRMEPGRFWVANIASAVIWAPMLLLAGDVAGRIGTRLFGSADIVVLLLAGVTLFGIAGVVWAVVRSGRAKR